MKFAASSKVVLGIVFVTALEIACGGAEAPTPTPTPTAVPPVATSTPAPVPIGSGTVGAAGGALTFGDVAVSVPPGALSSDVTITVEKGGAAPGYRVFGDVYHFAPAGLHFAVPITVTLPGDHGFLFWTKDGSETTFEAQGTLFGFHGTASAQVSHFSSGFVGTTLGTSTPDGGDDDGGETVDAGEDVDAGDMSDAGGMSDGGGGDAGSDAGLACVGPVNVDKNGSATATFVSVPRASWGCPGGASLPPAGVGGPSATVLEFTKPTRFTTWTEHSTLHSINTVARLFTGCDPGAEILKHPSAGSGGCGGTTMDLQPGRYTFVACDTFTRFQAAPLPVTTATNTSCAMAAPYRYYQGMSAPSAGPDQKYYWKFTGTKGVLVELGIDTIGKRTGRESLVVQSVCDDDSTTLKTYANAGCGLAGGGTSFTPSVTGTYYVVLTNVDTGFQVNFAPQH